jgi:hypothetical protein
VRIRGCRLYAVVDPGSKYSLINSKICDKLGVKTKIPLVTKRLTANGNDLRVIGVTTVDIDIETCSYIQQVCSTQDLSVDLVLGYDFVNQFSTRTWQQPQVDSEPGTQQDTSKKDMETQTHVEPEKSHMETQTQTDVDQQQTAGTPEPPADPGQQTQILDPTHTDRKLRARLPYTPTTLPSWATGMIDEEFEINTFLWVRYRLYSRPKGYCMLWSDYVAPFPNGKYGEEYLVNWKEIDRCHSLWITEDLMNDAAREYVRSGCRDTESVQMVNDHF